MPTFTDFTFPSTTGKNTIHARKCVPDGAVRGVVQIAHGVAEYIDRYDPFMSFLADNGFVVVGNDHLGHGKSIASPEEQGFFNEADGWNYVVADMDRLHDLTVKDYPDLPYIFFGHSMGSFVCRDYISRYAANVDGAIVCGTAGTNKLIGAAITISSAICGLRGRKYRSKFIRNLAFKGYNDDFPGEGELAWLSRDKDVRDAYDADPLCGFIFTAGGYNEMFRLLKSVSGPEWAAKIPQSLPVFVIAGSMDPVGAKGDGPREVHQLLVDRELTDIDCKIYDGMRHEIHNEIGREEVMEDIAKWVLRVADGAAEAATL